MANIPFNTASIIRCFTTEHMNKLKEQDPALGARLNVYEQRMQDEIRRVNGVSDTDGGTGPNGSPISGTDGGA